MSVTINVPFGSVLEVVKNKSGNFSFNRGTVLSGRLVEKKLGNVTILATRETVGETAAEKESFGAWCDQVREVILARKPAPVLLGKSATAAALLEKSSSKVTPKAEEPTWCHYHKAAVGHSIDHCPDVFCRVCKRKGHTDKVCETPLCEVCNRFGHHQEECYTKIKCTNCNHMGHPQEKCYTPVRVAPEPKAIWCSYHEVENSHTTAACPDLKNWECENCGEKGHYFKNCRNPMIVRHRPVFSAPVDTREFITTGVFAQPVKSRGKKASSHAH